jgi:hypothetical protein
VGQGIRAADQARRETHRQHQSCRAGQHREPAAEKRSRLAITDATMLRTAAHRAAAEPATTPSQENTLATRASPDRAEPPQTPDASKATADAADSAWLEARRARPTLVLPTAAIATLLSAYLHLFLLHGMALSVHDGLPASRLSFALDALLTGLALAAGAKLFHDLAESTTASSAAKKAAATSRRLSRGSSASSGRSRPEEARRIHRPVG